MELFSQSKINILGIHSVEKYYDESNVRIHEFGQVFNSHELVLSIVGESIADVGGTVMRDCPGSIRFMPKGRINGKYIVESITRPSLCIDIYFDAADMPKKPIGLYGYEKLKDKFLKLYDIWTKKEVGYYARSMALLYEIAATLQQGAHGYLSSAQRDYMQKAYNYIAENYKSANFDYKELCRVSGLEYAYFSELFKKTYNMSPVKLVTNMKIEHAKGLLIANRHSVAEIAEICGYSDVSYFSKVFKKQTGFSPTRYPTI